MCERRRVNVNTCLFPPNGRCQWHRPTKVEIVIQMNTHLGTHSIIYLLDHHNHNLHVLLLITIIKLIEKQNTGGNNERRKRSKKKNNAKAHRVYIVDGPSEYIDGRREALPLARLDVTRHWAH